MERERRKERMRHVYVNLNISKNEKEVRKAR